MSRACPRCGAAAGTDARFCANCGAPLELPAGAERKLATMVFADLVGSTELASGLDPEEFRGRLAPFFDVARAALEEHGGTIEKYIGDAVLAVFGVPRAHDDDPDRAVAAALALVDRLRQLDPELHLRIGIETGEVLATGSDGDLSVVGEAVNAAARLQQAARPGEVLVGARAAAACRRTQLEPGRPVEAKGLPAPLRTWRALDVAAARDFVDAPLRGRDDDLDLLRLIYRRAVRERVPQLVTITGDAGIGKTRLAMELVSELRAVEEPPRIFVGRNPPYGRGIAFWALGEILRDAAGLEGDAEPAEIEAGLRALLAGLGAPDADSIAHGLAVALGLGRALQDDADAEDALRTSWRRLVAVLAADRPLMLVIDDAHWADDGFLDLIEEVAFGVQDVPLLVLSTSRPQLFERRSSFGRSARNVTQIDLSPLDEESVAAIVERLLPPERHDEAPQVAAVAAGNPFFAEEVARAISESGNGHGRIERLPDTVHAAIAARMDALPPAEKRALQVAAVLGQRFRDDALTTLMETPQPQALAALTRKALLRERVADGPGRYSFRHQLIREVAYDSLPRQERARLHERAAESLRASGGEVTELVAFHRAQAAALAPSEPRREAALAATLAAAKRAHERGAIARAQELHEQAATYERDPAARARSLFAAAELAIRRWRGDHGYRLMREAGEVAESAGDAPFAATAYGRAVEIGGRMPGVTGQIPEEELRGLLARAEALAPGGDAAVSALLQLDEIWIRWAHGLAGRAPLGAGGALALAREAADPRLLSSALDAATAEAWMQHRHRDALAHVEERIEVLEAAPRSVALAVEANDVRHMLIECMIQTGAFRDAATEANRAREFDLSHGMIYSAWARVLLPAYFLGEWDELLRAAGRVREAWLAAERPPMGAMATGLATAGAVLGLRGRDDAAADWFQVAHSVTHGGTGQLGGQAMMEAAVAVHRGDLDAAVELLENEDGGFWWQTPYQALRAEVFILAGRTDAEVALAQAERIDAQQPYAQALARRARALLTGDAGLLGESRRRFAELECPFEEARTAWLAGGAARRDAERLFARLGATPPAG